MHPTTAPPTFSLQDHLGSTIALTGETGAIQNRLAYDEYGNPRTGDGGRFGYTGQLWLPELGVYHYKAPPPTNTPGAPPTAAGWKRMILRWGSNWSPPRAARPR